MASGSCHARALSSLAPDQQPHRRLTTLTSTDATSGIQARWEEQRLPEGHLEHQSPAAVGIGVAGPVFWPWLGTGESGSK